MTLAWLLVPDRLLSEPANGAKNKKHPACGGADERDQRKITRNRKSLVTLISTCYDRGEQKSISTYQSFRWMGFNSRRAHQVSLLSEYEAFTHWKKTRRFVEFFVCLFFLAVFIFSCPVCVGLGPCWPQVNRNGTHSGLLLLYFIHLKVNMLYMLRCFSAYHIYKE